jgi:hypothetical protein
MPKPKDRDIAISLSHADRMKAREGPQREAELAKTLHGVLGMMLLGMGRAAPTLGTGAKGSKNARRKT